MVGRRLEQILDGAGVAVFNTTIVQKLDDKKMMVAEEFEAGEYLATAHHRPLQRHYNWPIIMFV